MENDRIDLPIDLALTVIKQLEKQHGIKCGRTPRGPYISLSSEELSKIKKLEIQNPTPQTLEGIEKLPNLHTLSVKTTFSTAYTHPKNIPSISDDNVIAIQKCSNLKVLEIVNQTNISEINLNNLPGLECVNISKNANLETITGIDKLPELDSLECFGNKSLQEIKGLDRAIAERDLCELNLDVLLFPKAIGYQLNGNYNQQSVNAMEKISRISWQETLTNEEKIKINHANMLEMHNKACKIIEQNVNRASSNFDKIVAIEKYLAENVVYDDESLKNNHSRTFEGSLGLRIVDGPSYGANSVYNCIMYNSCVCEGYTRGEQYLLELCGIKSRNTHCIAGKDTMGMANNNKDLKHETFKLPNDGYHSIIRIDDYYCMYSDPCWNACHWQSGDKSLPFTLLTKSEISGTHTLSFEERDIDEAQPIKRSRISESIRYDNDLFKETTASEVAAQRTAAKNQTHVIVKGSDGHVY